MGPTTPGKDDSASVRKVVDAKSPNDPNTTGGQTTSAPRGSQGDYIFYRAMDLND
jgi:hypothetical protein